MFAGFIPRRAAEILLPLSAATRQRAVHRPTVGSRPTAIGSGNLQSAGRPKTQFPGAFSERGAPLHQ